MAFQIPELDFQTDMFGEFISEETFEFHYGKHHSAYVKKLNANIDGTDYESMELEEIIKSSYEEGNMAVFNNAAQHFNHSFFWECLSPEGGGEPGGRLLEMINETYGSFEDFKQEFIQAATGLFGSGWVWLVINEDNSLEIANYSNAGNPITDNKWPLLTLDVWEHAYYIDHRNQRPQFISMFWDYINWQKVEDSLMS